MTDDVDNNRMNDDSTNNNNIGIAVQVLAQDDNTNSDAADVTNDQITKFVISSITDNTIDTANNTTNTNLLQPPELSINMKQYFLLNYYYKQNQLLTKLILNNNIYIGDYGISLISYILVYNNTITELNLDNTIGITDIGANQLSSRLQYHPTISHFSIISKYNKQLTCFGIYNLLIVLEYNETLVSIKFDNVLSIDNYYYIMAIYTSDHLTLYNKSLCTIQFRYSNSCTTNDSIISLDVQKEVQVQHQLLRNKSVDDCNYNSQNETITCPKIGTRRRHDIFSTLLSNYVVW